MLTVLVSAESAMQPLVATFRSLMGATLEGLVSDVMVRGPAALRPVCEPAGASLAEDGEAVEAVLREARGRWLLALEAGAVPHEGWEAAVARHVARSGSAARFRVAEPSLWRALVGRRRRPLRAGLLLPMEVARAGMRDGAPDTLAIGRAAATLDVRLTPARDDPTR